VSERIFFICINKHVTSN